MIFKSLFANDGLVNRVLSTVGIPTVDWFQNAWAARWVIVIALVWRWTGYNMVFYLAGLQNIDYSIYEAARIDGASPLQQFVHLTIPLLKPTILLTAIMSTSGTLQLFDESVNLTAGGPGKATMTLTHYIYNISFVETPKFNYAAALSVFILVVVAVLSAIQMKVGDITGLIGASRPLPRVITRLCCICWPVWMQKMAVWPSCCPMVSSSVVPAKGKSAASWWK